MSQEEIELQVERAKDMVEMEARLERLERNEDFRALITEGYMREEAIRLVHAKGAPNMDAPDIQASLVKQIDAIGGLTQYFYKIRAQGVTAQKALDDYAEMEAEDMAEGIH